MRDDNCGKGEDIIVDVPEKMTRRKTYLGVWRVVQPEKDSLCDTVEAGYNGGGKSVKSFC